MKRKRSVWLNSGQDAVEERGTIRVTAAMQRIDGELVGLYRRALAEMHRVLAPGGRVVLLTNQPDLVQAPAFRCLQHIEISLFGQSPIILVLETHTSS